MKTLITGGEGQLGRAFQSLVPQAMFVDRTEFDLNGPLDNLVATLKAIKPSIVINCAAHTNADNGETEPEVVFRINSDAVKTIGATCQELGARFITYSTDYVFDGTPVKGGYREDSPTHPLSIYGESKVRAEESVKRLKNATAIRTSWVFGDGSNFMRTMLNLADKGLTNISVVNDQIGRPTYASDLAKATLELLEHDNLPHLIHVTNEGEPRSWADIARTTFDLCHRDVKVTPISTEEFFKNKAIYAKRPHYSVLNLDLLHSFGITLRPWDEALKDYLK